MNISSNFTQKNISPNLQNLVDQLKTKTDEEQESETTTGSVDKAAQAILKPALSKQEIFCNFLNKGAKKFAVIGNLLLGYHLFDRGLANFLNLSTFRHGTNLPSYFGISLFGADPKRGGSTEPHALVNPPQSSKLQKIFMVY